MTPIGTAMITSQAASVRLCTRASRSSGSFHTESGLLQYHWVEKPCQTVRERLSLNENWMAMITGTIAHSM